MLIKRIAPGAQDFGCPVVEQIKVTANGLRGNDLREFVKRAGHSFADQMRDVRLAPGEIPIHLIALGAYERYGFNRNGDGFKMAACRKYHPTFVKYARFYRNHNNKDTSKSYGIIKMSHYNEAMHRIELLVALNGTKEAAERNGGLLADKEMEKLASNSDDWGVSMACRVPYDECSGCHNRARNRSEYCTESTCKYGGCMHNLTKVAEDGHVLGVFNDDPSWFDISDVGKPADRIAWVMGPMQKAAGIEKVGGAQMAEAYGLTLPPHLRYEETDARTAKLIKLAYEMADLEASLVSGKMGHSYDELALRNQPNLDTAEQFTRYPVSRTQVWHALANEKIALTVSNWLTLMPQTGNGVLTKQASASSVQDVLPGVFTRMIADGDSLEAQLADRMCDPSQSTSSERVRMWAAKHASAMSISPPAVDRRRVAAIVASPSLPAPGRIAMTKSASQNQQTEQLARQYAVYQLHLLNEWQRDMSLPAMKELMIRQNHLA